MRDVVTRLEREVVLTMGSARDSGEGLCLMWKVGDNSSYYLVKAIKVFRDVRYYSEAGFRVRPWPLASFMA